MRRGLAGCGSGLGASGGRAAHLPSSGLALSASPLFHGLSSFPLFTLFMSSSHLHLPQTQSHGHGHWGRVGWEGGPAAGWLGATHGQNLLSTGSLGRIWCWEGWDGDSQLACDTPHPFWGLPSFQGTGPAPSHRAPARQPRRAPESLAHLPAQASEQLPLLTTPWGFARPSGLLLLCTRAHLGPWEPQDHRSWLIHQRRRMPARPEPCHPCT